MYIEYTPEEQKRFIKIENHYKDLLFKLENEIQEAVLKGVDCDNLLEKREKIFSESAFAVTELTEQIKNERFALLGNDIDAILEDAKKQVNLILLSHIDDLAQYDLVVENTEDMEKPDFIAKWVPRYIAENKKHPQLEFSKAMHIVNSGLILHRTALKTDKNASNELRDFIYQFLNASIYVSVDKPKETAAENLIKLDRKAPLMPLKTYGLMNDKVNNHMLALPPMKGNLDGQLVWLLDQAGKNAKEEVPVLVSLQYMGTEKNLSKSMTRFDMEVYNALSTSYFYHKQQRTDEFLMITPQELWRVMNGDNSNKTPSAKQTEKVCKSLDKMRSTFFTIDFKQEIEKHYIDVGNDDKLKSGYVETYLLEADKAVFFSEKGKKLTGYKIKAEPILYKYNSMKNHIISVSFELLDTSNKTDNDGYTIEFRSYLLQQIQLMYDGSRNSTRILYSTIYGDTGVDEPEARLEKNSFKNENSYNTKVRTERAKDRKKITSILEAWKEKGYINDFEEVKEKGKYRGVDIVLNTKNNRFLTSKKAKLQQKL